MLLLIHFIFKVLCKIFGWLFANLIPHRKHLICGLKRGESDQFKSVPHKIYDICCCEMRMSATSLTFWLNLRLWLLSKCYFINNKNPQLINIIICSGTLVHEYQDIRAYCYLNVRWWLLENWNLPRKHYNCNRAMELWLLDKRISIDFLFNWGAQWRNIKKNKVKECFLHCSIL